jgi:outer membrane protein assembly factor BamB
MLTSSLLMTAILAAPGAAQWPQFHGPNHDNRSKETGLLKQWPEGGPKLLWTATGCGIGFSSLAVANNTIYTAGGVNDTTVVLAFDMQGQPKWQSPNGPHWKPRGRGRFGATFGGSRPTPTVDGDRVYHLSSLGRLAAYQVVDGKELWNVDIVKAFGAKMPRWGFSESVLVDGDKVILYPGGPKGYMVALDKRSGKVVWANTDIGDPASYCSAAPVEIRGRRQLVTLSTKSVLGVDPESGKLLWRHPFENKRATNITMPLVLGDRIFATHGYGGGSLLLQLQTGAGPITVKELWRTKQPDNHHGCVVHVDGRVYATGHRRQGLCTVSLADGRILHKTEGKGTFLYADGLLYFLDESGAMSLIDPSQPEHRVVSSFAVPSGGQGQYWAHPVVCGKRLYVRHADKLFAYDIAAGR